MLMQTGSKDFPIWLLGDSNPKNWADKLDTPLDARHPAIHNIWTPIIDSIQDQVYRQAKLRIDTSSLYIRNAIEKANLKPKENQTDWSAPVQEKVHFLRELISQNKPVFLFCFGSFSYEFCRRAKSEEPIYSYKYWSTKKLGDNFRYQINNFKINQTNIFPLLHATIARRHFLISHNYYCGIEGANYFIYVGNKIADIILEYRDKLNIWV